MLSTSTHSIDAAHTSAALYVDTAKAAKITGMSESWFEHDRLAIRPEIPFSRFGTRSIRYAVADLIAYGEARKVAA